MNMPNLPNDFLWIIIAFFGGIARYLDTYLKGEVFSWKRMLATIILCSFAGYMCAMIALTLFPSWALISAGIGGYIGVEVLPMLANIWKTKMNIKGTTNDEKK